MGDKTDDAQGRRLIEVHRASPYEFCLTAEPCLVTNVQAAMSGVVSPQSVAEPTQMFQMFHQRLPNGEIKYSALDVESTWEAVSVTGSEASGSAATRAVLRRMSAPVARRGHSRPRDCSLGALNPRAPEAR